MQCSGAERNVPADWDEQSGASWGKPSQHWLARIVCWDVVCSGLSARGWGDEGQFRLRRRDRNTVWEGL